MQLSNHSKIFLRIFCNAILATQDPLGSSGRWPMPKLRNTVEATIFSEPYVVFHLYDCLKMLYSRGLNAYKISKLISWPSGYARLPFIFRSRAVWPLKQSEQIELLNLLTESLSYTYRDNIFCSKQDNILLLDSQVKEIVKFLKTKTSYQIPSNLVSQLDGRLWMQSEMLFSRWHNLGHEFHGPYKVGNEWLLIKVWHDFNGFRPFLGKFPHNLITCYEFYKNNKVYLDLHNRMWSKKPLVSTIIRSYVSYDDNLVGKNKIDSLIKILNHRLARGEKYLATRSIADLKIINAEMEFYAFKELALAAGKSYNPPKELIRKIKKGALSKREKKVLEKLSIYYKHFTKKNLNIQFNPSINFWHP